MATPRLSPLLFNQSDGGENRGDTYCEKGRSVEMLRRSILDCAQTELDSEQNPVFAQAEPAAVEDSS